MLSVVLRGSNEHICELQIAHYKIGVVRKEMGGHSEYAEFRSMEEILQRLEGSKDWKNILKDQRLESQPTHVEDLGKLHEGFPKTLDSMSFASVDSGQIPKLELAQLQYSGGRCLEPNIDETREEPFRISPAMPAEHERQDAWFLFWPQKRELWGFALFDKDGKCLDFHKLHSETTGPEALSFTLEFEAEPQLLSGDAAMHLRALDRWFKPVLRNIATHASLYSWILPGEKLGVETFETGGFAYALYEDIGMSKGKQYIFFPLTKRPCLENVTLLSAGEARR